MELSKKTTILFPPELHDQLMRRARHLGVSMGELVREACVLQYGIVSEAERTAAVRDLARLSLPVGQVKRMKQESVPKAEDLIP